MLTAGGRRRAGYLLVDVAERQSMPLGWPGVGMEIERLSLRQVRLTVRGHNKLMAAVDKKYLSTIAKEAKLDPRTVSRVVQRLPTHFSTLVAVYRVLGLVIKAEDYEPPGTTLEPTVDPGTHPLRTQTPPPDRFPLGASAVMRHGSNPVVIHDWDQDAAGFQVGPSYSQDRPTAGWALCASGSERFSRCAEVTYHWFGGTWCGVYINFSERDVSQTREMSVWVRGAVGGENIGMGLKGKNLSDSADAIPAPYPIGSYTRAGSITDAWQEAIVPLEHFPVLEATSLWSIVFLVVERGASGSFWLGPISFQ